MVVLLLLLLLLVVVVLLLPLMVVLVLRLVVVLLMLLLVVVGGASAIGTVGAAVTAIPCCSKADCRSCGGGLLGSNVSPREEMVARGRERPPPALKGWGTIDDIVMSAEGCPAACAPFSNAVRISES